MYFLAAAFLVGFARSAPPDPSCQNDFIKTMVCHFPRQKDLNCSDCYIQFLPGSPNRDDKYTCSFKEDNKDLCICTVEMIQFITGEKYKAEFFSRKNKLHSNEIYPSDHIKPNAPTIESVAQKEDGNYIVRWNSHYPESTYLFDSLKFQLNYRKKDELEQLARIVNSSLPFTEVLGRELEENRIYVVKARSYSDYYKTDFSDWSQEMEWKTSASTVTMLKIFIPFLCIFLIFILCAAYWATTRVKSKWWDNIPKPSMVHLILPDAKSKVDVVPQNNVDPILNVSIEYCNPEKIQGNVEGDLPQIKMDEGSGDSLLSNYAHTYSVSQTENISSSEIQNIMHFNLEKALSPFFNFGGPGTNSEPPTMQELYKNVDGTAPRKDSGISMSEGTRLHDMRNLGSYKNVSYSWVSPSQGSGQLVLKEKPPFISPCTATDEYHSCGNEVSMALPPLGMNLPGLPLPSTTVTLSPFILMDLEYHACDNKMTTVPTEEDLSSAHSSELHNDPGRSALPSDVAMTSDGYQSFSSAVNKASLDVEQLTKDKFICSVNPAYTGLLSHSCGLDLSDDGYQALPGMTLGSKVQQEGMNKRNGDNGLDGISLCSRNHTVTAIGFPSKSTDSLPRDPPACTVFNKQPVFQIVNNHHYHKV